MLIIVPRHPERFDEVEQQIINSGLRYCRRSLNEVPSIDTQVYLADSMGELSVWYQLADVAFVGGSMVNVGGHNPIEALSVGTPVIMGQFTHSLTAIADELKAQAVLQQLSVDYQHKKGDDLDDTTQAKLTEQLYQILLPWLQFPERAKQVGEVGQRLVKANQEVIERQLQMIIQVQQSLHSA